MVRRAMLLVVFAAAVCAPASASTNSLTSTAYGALDFGDRIAYHVTGNECSGTSPHIRVLAAGTEIDGPESQPMTDPTDPSRCTGAAQAPDYNDVRAAGWRQGDPIAFDLVTGDQAVPLRFARIEADLGSVAAGTPSVVPANDPDTGAWDNAVSLAQGDAISIGRVDLSRVEALSLRICVPLGVGQSISGVDAVEEERHEVPTYVSVHQESISGPALISSTDVASDPFTDARLDTHGFGHGCWRLLTLPLTGSPVESAPPLYVVVDTAVAPIMLNSIDIDGTAAKLPGATQQDPPGTETIFDGTSFDGWSESNCVIRDGAAASSDSSQPGSGCAMTYQHPVHNIVLRFDLRRENFFDNGAIQVPNEIQIRSAGEYGPGGYFGEDAARWEKFNTYPDWSQIEIVQLGARYVVTLNGRTVTDHVASGGDPAPYRFQLVNQPEWAYRYGVSGGFGDESPNVVMPTSWGRFWYRNVRLYECSSVADPVCTSIADARPGEAPKA